MRKWIKFGLISSISVLFVSLVLILLGYIYYNTTKRPNINNDQLTEIPNNKPQEEITPPNNENIIPKPPENIPTEKPNQPPSIIKPNPELPNVDNPPVNNEPNNNSGVEENKPPVEENKPESGDNVKPPVVEDNSKPNDEVKPPVEENKPKPDDNVKPPVVEENTNKPEEIKPMQFSILKYFDKYEFVKNVTNYETYFFNNRQLKFNEIKLRINTYQYIKDAIVKASKIDLNINVLKIKVYYQIDKFNYSKLRLLINWTIKSNNSSILEKKYYDNIHINLKKV